MARRVGLLLLLAPSAAAVVATCTNYTDCTAELMAAIDSCEDVDVPPLPGGRPWIVTPLHITCNDTRISLRDGVTIEAMRGAFHGLGDHYTKLRPVAARWPAAMKGCTGTGTGGCDAPRSSTAAASCTAGSTASICASSSRVAASPSIQPKPLRTPTWARR